MSTTPCSAHLRRDDMPARVERTFDAQFPNLEGEVVPLEGEALRWAEPSARQREQIGMESPLDLRGGLEQRRHLGCRERPDGPLAVHADGGGVAAAPPGQLGRRIQREKT